MNTNRHFDADELFEISVADSRGIDGKRWVKPSVAHKILHGESAAAPIMDRGNYLMIHAERIRAVELSIKIGLMDRMVWTADDDKMTDALLAILTDRSSDKVFSMFHQRPNYAE